MDNVILGDCLEVMKDIPDKRIDMILCDLPYGTTRNKWDSIISLDLLWEQYKRIIKENGAIVLTAQTPFDKVLGASNISILKYEWIWHKTRATGFLNSKSAPMKAHENILVFYKRPPTYNPQGLIQKLVPTIRKGRNNGTNYGKSDKDAIQGFENYPITVLPFHSEGNILHPTQKPIALMEYLIKTYTNEGDLVLDNCAGSGTTLLAAKNLNRRFIGIEKEQKYFDIIKERLYGNN